MLLLGTFCVQGAESEALRLNIEQVDLTGVVVRHTFEYDSEEGLESLELRATAFAAEHEIAMGEGCFTQSAECVGKRMARGIVEERGQERVISPARDSVRGYVERPDGDSTSVVAGSQCLDAVLDLRESGTWRDVDLSAYDDMNARLDRAIGNVDQVRLGHSGSTTGERQWYVAAARLPCVKRICEVGFNEGHSAALWLLANPTAEVVMFDLYDQPSAALGEAFLRDAFGDDRLYVVRGPSQWTVPMFSETRVRGVASYDHQCLSL